VEPDIAKVKTTRSLRAEFMARNQASFLTDANESYADEREELREPDWRLAAIAPTKNLERFPDPNAVTRGVSRSAAPKGRYQLADR
jgi:hypothetical protein